MGSAEPESPPPASSSPSVSSAGMASVPPVFDPAPVFRRNALWIAPSLESLESVSFTHSVEPRRLDERFLWRRDGTSLLEVVAPRDGANVEEVVNEEIGSRWITTPEPALYYARPRGEFAARDTQRERYFVDRLRERLLGTWANFVALDWGRRPGIFVVRSSRASDDGNTIVLEVHPVIRDYALAAGSMFYSAPGTYYSMKPWSQIHGVKVERSEIVIDAETFRIVGEKDFSPEGELKCEIVFGDWEDVTAGQSVPRSIHLHFPDDGFDVEYRFQWRPEGLWILAGGCSAFSGQEPQIETVRDLKINESLPDLDDALTLVEESERYLESTGIDCPKITLRTYPFSLGNPIPFPPAQSDADARAASLAIADLPAACPTVESLLFTLHDDGGMVAELGLRRKSKSNAASGSAILILFDGTTPRPLHAVETPFVFRDDALTTTVALRFGRNRTLADATAFHLALVVPGGATAFSPVPADLHPSDQPLVTCPLQYDTAVPLDIPYTGVGYFPGDIREPPEKTKTRIKQTAFRRDARGRTLAEVEVLSIEPRTEYEVGVPVVILSAEGTPLAAGEGRTTFEFEEGIDTRSVAFDMGDVARQGAADRQFAVGLTREPTRSTWTRKLRFTNYGWDGPIFPPQALLDAQDPRVRAAGVRAFEAEMRQRWSQNTWVNVRTGRVEVKDGYRTTQLKPHLDWLAERLAATEDPPSLGFLCRLAGHSRDPRYVPALTALLGHPHESVRDAAAIGLGLLGDAAGRARLQLIIDRPAPGDSKGDEFTDPWGKSSDWKSDAALALATLNQSI